MNNPYESQLARLRELEKVASTIDKLQTYWTRHPYLRLGQIVSNAWRVHPDYRKNPEPDIQDVFYLTDEKFLEGLKILEDESQDQGSSKG